MKPLVGVVIPVGGRINASEWMMAVRSVVDQDYPLNRIRVVQVLRIDDDMPTPVISTTKPKCKTAYYKAKSTDAPTVFEQIEIGYKHAIALGCEFVCVCSSNDVMEPFKITDEVYALQENPEAMVAYGDLVIWDDGDDSVFIDAGFNFNPIVGEFYANGMPDICTIRSSVFTEIPFVGSDGEASNDIMFLRMFEKYGDKAFIKTSRPNYIYRKHEQALSRNMELHGRGKARLVKFMNEYKPLADRGVCARLRLAHDPPRQPKDIEIQFIERDNVYAANS